MNDAEVDAGAELAHTNDLPDWMKDTESGVILGQNVRSYSCIGGCVNVITVLVQGAINDYAAYSAGGRDTEWAKRYGGKISFKEACVHFPGLVKERYRR